jgi:hypothetical protein
MSETTSLPEEDTTQPNLEGIQGSDEVNNTVDDIQKRIFGMWFDEAIIRGPKRREYKVPTKILALPCGCERDRGYEGDRNNIWKIKKRKSGKYFHKECGEDIDV